jgi:hypothetical protein
MMGGGSSCSAPRLRSKNDVAHMKADFFSVEFTADFWYLSVVSGAKRTPIKTSNNTLRLHAGTSKSKIMMQASFSEENRNIRELVSIRELHA